MLRLDTHGEGLLRFGIAFYQSFVILNLGFSTHIVTNEGISSNGIDRSET